MLMWPFYDFFYYNKAIVMFIYGSIFFLLGFGILLKNRQHSRFELAKNLHWLGLFGIVHGLADLGHVFIPIQRAYSSDQTYLILRIIQIIINALSFMFIFQFGVSLWTNTKKKWHKLKYMPVLLFILWLSFLIVTISSFNYKSNLEWILINDIWSRYLIGFPGAIFSGYAILLQKNEFDNLASPKSSRALQFGAISLITYSFASGLIVAPSSVGLSRLINSDLFFQLTGLPIEIVRAFTGLILFISIFIILLVFDKEYINRIQESEITKARFEERNRLAQDLHDDIIQSLYATNLELEVIKYLINKNPQRASEKLAVFLKNGNRIIDQIREYIGELKRVNQVNISLQKRIENIINEFHIKEKLNVQLEFDYIAKQITVTPLYHLTLILKEAMSNVIKHANAKNLTIKISNNNADLILEIIDDGIGFNEKMRCRENSIKDYSCMGSGHGLQNIKERVKTLNGSLEIESKVNEGTKIIIRVPLEGGLYD